MRVFVKSCDPQGVMGGKEEKASELIMCPLTSSISAPSHASDMGSFYPRRILLSFLRKRLGKQELPGNSRQQFTDNSSNNSHFSFTRLSKQISQAVCKDTLMMEEGNRKMAKCNNSSSRAKMASSEEANGVGGMCNRCFAGPIPSSQPTQSSLHTCCTSQNISPSENINTLQFLVVDKDNNVNECPMKQNVGIISSFHSSSHRHGNNNDDEDRFTSPPVYSKQISCSSRRCAGFSGISKVFLLFLILSLITGSSACGPGRGAGRRRAPRKLTPLVYKQHVPNVPENTLSASGFTEGRITRKDPKFKNLVPNYNQDIIFRDEEGTGADRLMTQRCKEKLNTLAISVMNQWPGVKLRVIEGWDEEMHHATHSLHYEGRAVDITTSDKDRSKYGMLARLAVEAGFDWVYYESRAHIHCSVKSDSSQATRTGGCFSGNSTVETPSGPKRMDTVKPGDKILTIDSDGHETFSDVLMFLDRNTTEVREFFEVKTESGTALTLTPSHLLYSIQPEGVTPDDEFLLNKNRYLRPDEVSKYFLDQAEITFAKFVQIGDWVLVKQEKQREGNSNQVTGSHPENLYEYAVEKVISIEAVVETGVYAPLTSTGNLVVDGVLTSCYALIDDQTLAHLAFAPVRLANNFRQSITYLWRQFSRFVSFSHHAAPEEQLHHQGDHYARGSSSSSAAVANHLSTQQEEDQDKETKFNRPEKTQVPKRVSNWESRSSQASDDRESAKEQGIHWYASFLYSATRYILPSHLLYE